MKPGTSDWTTFSPQKLLPQVSDSFFELTNRACGIFDELVKRLSETWWEFLCCRSLKVELRLGLLLVKGGGMGGWSQARRKKFL